MSIHRIATVEYGLKCWGGALSGMNQSMLLRDMLAGLLASSVC